MINLFDLLNTLEAGELKLLFGILNYVKRFNIPSGGKIYPVILYSEIFDIPLKSLKNYRPTIVDKIENLNRKIKFIKITNYKGNVGGRGNRSYYNFEYQSEFLPILKLTELPLEILNYQSGFLNAGFNKFLIRLFYYLEGNKVWSGNTEILFNELNYSSCYKTNFKNLIKHIRICKEKGIEIFYNYSKNNFTISNIKINPLKTKKNVLEPTNITKISSKITSEDFQREDIVYLKSFNKECNLIGNLIKINLESDKQITLEKELHERVDKELKKLNVNYIHKKELKTIAGLLDTVFINGDKHYIIEYKMNSDKRVISQIWGYKNAYSKLFSIPKDNIELIIIQQNFKLSDFLILEDHQGISFYTWSQVKDGLILKLAT